MKKKIKLVRDWKHFYKWYSVQAKAVVVAILFIWDKLPTELKNSIPQSCIMWIAISILVIGGFGTLIEQHNADS